MPIDKIIDPNVAANAYLKNSNMANQAGVAADDGVSFSEFLKKTAQDSIETMKTGEEMSAKAITGEADLVDVVEAINAAEVTLETVVAIRDRMISAYQEIMRMPI